jgi:hypothetical protein
MSEICYVEILLESRELSITQTSTEQVISIQFQLPKDEEDDSELATPEFEEAEFMGAIDDVLAREVASDLLPAGRLFPNSDGDALLLILTGLKISQVDNSDWWKAVATYKYDDNTGTGGAAGEPGDKTLPYIRIGFAGGGGSVRKSWAYGTSVGVGKTDAGPARPVPETGNAIGVTEDNVEGTEVPGGGLSLSVTAYYYPEVINDASFLRDVARLFSPECPVNSDPFLGFNPGEVLLLSMQGDYVLNDIVPIVFEFSIKENLSGVADTPFPPITCDGHALLDYRYVKQLDDTSQAMLQLPSFRFIHQVHLKKPFSVLGIPQVL